MIETWLHVVTPMLTAIGVFVAAYGVMRNTENAKKRATLDMIIAERNDQTLQNAIRRVNELAKQEKILSIYLSESENDQQDRDDILMVLNRREFLCVALLSGALHEKMYKDFGCSMLLRDWDHLSSFIVELRRKNKMPTLFQEFETIARRWKKQPLRSKH